MSHVLDDLVELLSLEPIEENLFRGRSQDLGFRQLFGGQVLGQSLSAASQTVEPDRHVHSLHGYFLRPGDTTVPIVYDVENLRDGRSFATRRVVARQHGRPIYLQSVNFQIAEDGFDHQDTMPEVKGPEDGISLADLFADRRAAALSEHRGIIDAVVAGDSALAAARAEEHVLAAREETLAQLGTALDGQTTS